MSMEIREESPVRGCPESHDVGHRPAEADASVPIQASFRGPTLIAKRRGFVSPPCRSSMLHHDQPSAIARISMEDCRRLMQAVIVGLLLTTAMTPSVSAQTAPTTPPPSPVLRSYVYGYAPIVMEATRQRATAVPNATTFAGAAPVNQLGRVNSLETPAEKLVIRPNADMLITNAWLDLSHEPMVLHLPDTGGRYYLMPFLDAYSNVFASLGSRTTGTREGDYVIVGPDWKGRLPRRIAGVVHAPTNTVWLIGRTLVHGPSDLAAAVALANQYQLIPLTLYPNFLLTGSYTPPVSVPVTPPDLDFGKLPIGSGPGFSTPQFFDELLTISLKNPPPRRQEPQAELLVGEGELLKSLVTQDVENQAIAAFITELAKDTTNANGWTTRPDIGSSGSNYLLRSAIARFGLGANLPEDSVYYTTHTDISNNSLSGNNDYVIHFSPGQIPPVRGYWSVTVYGPDGFLIENSIKRYSIGSESGLVRNADGSIDILLQSAAPAAVPSNWLPTPAGEAFNLTLRLYFPDETVLKGVYTPPTVTSPAAPQLTVR
jgi:hypothetical protein